jgi:hypothetical protein
MSGLFDELMVVSGARGFPHHVVRTTVMSSGVINRRIIATCEHEADARAVKHWMDRGLATATEEDEDF